MNAEALVKAYIENGWTIATAESCTGGMVAASITDVAGSSAVLDCGFVTYSNAAKARMLGVDSRLIEMHGAVSEAVALDMAKGARAQSGATVAVAITGIAGPTGGSELKPVGLVHFACAGPKGVTHVERRFGNIGRAAVRQASVQQALQMLWDAVV